MRLALAQEAVGRKEEATAALNRFLQVETRFASYAGIRADAGIRTEFEALLRARVPAETLAAVRSLFRPPAQIVAQAPVVETAKPGQTSVVSESRVRNPQANDRNIGSPAVSPPKVVKLAEVAPVVVQPGITPPVALDTPAPAYPDLARRARVEGDVLVEAMIGADGAIREARVLRSTSPLLEPAALAAVRRWRYRPARVGERPVAVSINVVVTFSRWNQKTRQEP